MQTINESFEQWLANEYKMTYEEFSRLSYLDRKKIENEYHTEYSTINGGN